MATKTKEGAQGRDKRNTSPSSQNISSSQGRRITKSPAAGSPGKDNSTLPEKSTSRYLKTTASSSNESPKVIKKPTSNSVTTKPLTTRKSFDKAPPSPSQSQRTPPSASPSEKPHKPLSHSLKNVSSSRPVSNKPVKPLRNGVTQPLPRTKSLKKQTSNVKKGDTKTSPTAISNNANSTHDAVENSENLHEEQESSTVHEVDLETLKVEEEEQSPHEIEPIEYKDLEPDTSESDKLEASKDNTSSLVEEHDIAVTEEEGNKENDESENDNHHEEKEQVHNDEHMDGEQPMHLEENLAGEAHEQVDEEKLEGDEDDGKINNAGVESEKDIENEENERLEMKEGEAGSNEDPKQEAEKHQHVRGKKDSPAYNDVIEATASKLVKRQNSKVKALVGAFETVISLQEPEGRGNQ